MGFTYDPLAGYAPDAIVVVHRGATDAASMANLRAAYIAAKLLTPGGAALSRTNRACVILPPGGYNYAATVFVLDGEFVDLAALVPSRGSEPTDTMYAWTVDTGKYYPSDTTYTPPATYLYGEVKGATVTAGAGVRQSANDVRLTGFGILNKLTIAAGAGPTSVSEGDLTAYSGTAFEIAATNNSPSIYDGMWLWCEGAGLYSTHWRRLSCCATSASGFNGTWKNCISGGLGYRPENTGTHAPKCYDCVVGVMSWIGDYDQDLSINNGEYIRCKARGHFEDAYEKNSGELSAPASGYGAFGGCRSFSATIGPLALFEDDEAGDHSFGLASVNEGTFRRCRAAYSSFGGTRVAAGTDWTPRPVTASFDTCFAKGLSFGAGGPLADGWLRRSFSGTMRRVVCPEAPLGWLIVPPGKVIDCELSVTTAAEHCLHVGGEAVEIRNSKLIGGSSAKSIEGLVPPLVMMTRTAAGVYVVLNPASAALRTCLPSSLGSANDRLMIGIAGVAGTAPDINQLIIDIVTAASIAAGTHPIWKYSSADSGLVFAALTVGADGTDSGDGALYQDGTLEFTNPGAAWIRATYNGVAAYWIVLEVQAANITTQPILANVAFPVLGKLAAGRTGILTGCIGNTGLGDYTGKVATETNAWDTDIT